MTRIKICDLPEAKQATKEEMSRITGGRFDNSAIINSLKPGLSSNPSRPGLNQGLSSNILSSVLSAEVTETGGNYAGNLACDPKHPFDACFPAETQVLTRRGFRSIQSIKKGDNVLTFDTKTNHIVETIVMFVDVHVGEFELFTITFDDNEEIYATPNHKFHNGHCWIRCDEMTKVLTVSGEIKYITTSVSGKKYNFVYNIRTSYGTYIVGRNAALVSGGTILDLLDYEEQNNVNVLVHIH